MCPRSGTGKAQGDEELTADSHKGTETRLSLAEKQRFFCRIRWRRAARWGGRWLPANGRRRFADVGDTALANQNEKGRREGFGDFESSSRSSADCLQRLRDRQVPLLDGKIGQRRQIERWSPRWWFRRQAAALRFLRAQARETAARGGSRGAATVPGSRGRGNMDAPTTHDASSGRAAAAVHKQLGHERYDIDWALAGATTWRGGVGLDRAVILARSRCCKYEKQAGLLFNGATSIFIQYTSLARWIRPHISFTFI
jgi:hypothetical protein